MDFLVWSQGELNPSTRVTTTSPSPKVAPQAPRSYPIKIEYKKKTRDFNPGFSGYD